MTFKEIGDLYYIEKIIKRYKSRLQGLYRDLQRISIYQDMGHLQDLKRVVSEINDMHNKISLEETKRENIKNFVENKINKCGNQQARLILTLRCIDQLSWRDIAQKLGGNNTEESVRTYYHRLLNR